MNAKRDRARVIALASGKGGVGKTSIAVNLAVALARMKRRTMLMDCDFGMANAAIMLGINAAVDLERFASGALDLEAIALSGPSGLHLIPGGSAGNLPPSRHTLRRRLALEMRDRATMLDYVVVDTASGVSPQGVSTIADSDHVLLVVSSEPTAFMDAYAMLKLLTLEYGCTAVSVIANMVDDEGAGRELFNRFSDVAARFLASELDFLGSIPRDEHLRAAVFRKRCCLDAFPETRASAALLHLARALDSRTIAPAAGGERFFALEALQDAV